jgi:hypothetical protein
LPDDNPTAPGFSARIPQPAQLVGQLMSVQQLYANGFIINLTAADISIVMLRDNVANATLALSFTTAKTLCEQLGHAIKKLEDLTNKEIMTMTVVEEGLKKDIRKQ